MALNLKRNWTTEFWEMALAGKADFELAMTLFFADISIAK
jgi:hypothetical protein